MAGPADRAALLSNVQARDFFASPKEEKCTCSIGGNVSFYSPGKAYAPADDFKFVTSEPRVVGHAFRNPRSCKSKGDSIERGSSLVEPAEHHGRGATSKSMPPLHV